MPITSGRTRAVICDGFGGPEVLKIADVPRPAPGPGEILVRVRATALNRADLLQRAGSSMRPRPLADKRAITRKFRERWLPLLVAGRLRPVVDSVFPLEKAAEAHARMEANLNFGKILLTLD